MIEKEVFKKSIILPEKCLKYGFKKEKGYLVYHKNILNNSFEIIITISKNQVIGKVLDKECNEEYTNFRIELLEDIRSKCCRENNFIFPQANRICNWINDTYQDLPEFLWEDDKNGVFRNKTNQKWYGIIMYINQNKLDKRDRMIEVMNVKLPPEEIENLVKQKGFYRAYHMNKKHWITMILDETISDGEIQKLIETSYQYTIK